MPGCGLPQRVPASRAVRDRPDCRSAARAEAPRVALERGTGRDHSQHRHGGGGAGGERSGGVQRSCGYVPLDRGAAGGAGSGGGGGGAARLLD